MQNTADNLIAQQIASLDTLPADYTPNLESKWQLLETTLVEQRKSKRKLLLILRAAASIVFIVSLSLLYITFTKSTPKTLPATSHNSKPMILAPQNKTPETLTAAMEKKSPQKMQTVEKERTIPTLQIEAPPTDLEQEQAPMITENKPSEDTVQMLAALPKSAKKTKTRYIQMDFGESNAMAQNNQKPQLHTTGLKFNLAPTTRSSEPEARETKQNKSLRINF